MSAPRTRSAELTMNGIALLVGIALAVGMIEIACRFFYPLQTITTQLDDELIYARIPGSKQLFTRARVNGGETNLLRFNSMGYRGADMADSSSYRVAVYGDSFVEAYFSSESASFTGQLQSALEAKLDHPLVVLNGGVSGYGPDQAAKRIVRDFDKVRPDLVVLAVFAGNDFGDLLRNKLFHLHDGGLTQQKVRPSDEILREYESAREKSQRWKTRVLLQNGWKAFWHAIKGADEARDPAASADDFVRWAAERTEEFQSRNSSPLVTNLFNDGYEADMALAPDSTSGRYKSALMSAVMRHFGQSIAGLGVPAVVVVIPSPIDACEDYEWRVDAARYPSYRRDRLTDLAMRAAAAAQLPALDLFDRMASANCSSLFFHYGDMHWNDAGQRVAAEAVSEFIAARKLVRPKRPE